MGARQDREPLGVQITQSDIPFEIENLQYVERQVEGRELIEGRIGEDYRYAHRVIQSSGLHFDVGTYDGIGQPYLLAFADKVISIDINRRRLAQAAARPELQEPLQEGKLILLHMNATAIDKTLIPDGSCDSATCIEVFGSSFDGHDQREIQVFKSISDTLKPGGVLVFTVRSMEGDRLTKGLLFLDTKGVPMQHYTLQKRLIDEQLFSDVSFKGQVIMKTHDDGSLTIPPLFRDGQIVTASYVPRDVQEGEQPLYWVGVAVK